MDMDTDTLNALQDMDLQTAKERAVQMLAPNTKPTRMLRLKYDISKARTAQEVMRIMWNVYMAGTGFRVPTSQWQRHYNGC